MKVLPDVQKVDAKIGDNIALFINESFSLNYNTTADSDNNILLDLIEKKAYATTLLYLNENYTLLNNIDNKLLLEDLDELLHKNIKIVEAQGPELVSIKGYPIYEYENGVLRGSGKKKILESFDNDEEPIEEAAPQDVGGSRPGTMTGGTQVTDIAPKVDQEMNGTTEELEEKKKKLEDVLVSGIEEQEDILNRGFFKNKNGQYERNNFILVKEGERYLAIHKNKLNEYAVADDGTIEIQTPSGIVNNMKEYFSNIPEINSSFNMRTIDVDGAGAIEFKRKNKNVDLIKFSDIILNLMKEQGYENETDYEFDYKGDSFILAIKIAK